jgi:TolB-like protein/Flp pilus assembly protein TadD
LIGLLSRLARELRRRRVFRAAGVYLVTAFVVLQVVDAAFPYLPLPRSAGTLVLLLLAIGFPITLVLAWALEWTPEGLRKELPSPEIELRDDSIAVLPFENLSPEPENEYFSDGITEDITAAIAHIRGLRVLSRSSVLQYKNSQRPLGQIARELGAARLVTGSVRKAGGRIRIVAQVVDARTEAHTWAETYDRDLEDVFQVQSEVAAQVAGAVRRELSPDDLTRIQIRGTKVPQAYDLCLRARFLWNLRNENAVADSVEIFRRALALDPDFALAHVGLADAYTVLGIYGARAPAEVFPAARAAAQAALVVDSDLGEAIASEACVTAVYDWDWARGEKAFRKAIRLSPSYATAHQWYAMNLLAPLSRFDDARSELARAREIDPGSFAIAASQGIVSLYARDYDGALATLEAVDRTHPRFALVHYFLTQCHAAAGRVERSLEHGRRATELADRSPETLAVHAYALGLSGRRQDAEAALERLTALTDKRYVSRVLFAQVLLGLGRTEEALDDLERALEDKATDLIWLGVRPMYDPLRTSERFRKLMSAVGLPGG